MGDWRVIQDLAAGEALVAEVRARLTSTGAEKIAADAAQAMKQASEESFWWHRDPRTGSAWALAAESTLRDRRAGTLLHRTGQLEADVVAGYKVTPGGATAFVNVQAESIRKAMINLYGVSAKKSRTWTISKTGRTSSPRARLHQQFVIPSRRFIGLSDTKVATIMADAETIITGGLS